ncbi:MAG: hypothetical protein ACRD8U_05230 [Pyrinomonadaceae bacterium]
MKWPSLNAQILAGAVLGVVIGLLLQGSDCVGAERTLHAAGLVGCVFIDLLK